MSIAVETLPGASAADVARFCAGLPEPEAVEDRLQRYLRSGGVRPAWCFMAVGADGRIVARHWWWAAPGDPAPQGVDLLSAERFDDAVHLLRRARDELRVEEAICELRGGGQEQDAPGGDRFAELLRAAGFVESAARVRVSAAAAASPGVADRSAAVRPARDLPTEALVEVFRAAADGSLDSGMIEDRRRYGDLEEARRRVEQALSFDGEDDWFAVLVPGDGDETPAGYVVPALIDEIAVIAELGVAASHRGQGYGLKLLEHGVRVLRGAGATEIVADTDQANTVMRDVFARAGFVETEQYRTFQYARERPSRR
jgi:ribosomal protein S18 acetylase RimI-like enzyme